MCRALAQRLTRLEQQAPARDFPTWDEVQADAERLRAHAIATLQARLHHQDPPDRDEAQVCADQGMVER